MPTNFWSTICSSFRRTKGVHVDGPINHLPSELILVIVDNLPGFTNVNSLMRTNRRHLRLLMPIILDRAIISPPSYTFYGNRTIVHWAATHHHQLLPLLLQRPNVDTILDVPDCYGTTPLHSAALYGQQDRVEWLINKGANVNTTVDDEIGDGWTPLHCAAFRGLPKVTWKLLAAGADTEARTHVGGDTPLFLAALGDYHQTIERLLIQHGANTLARRKNGLDIQEFVQSCKDKRLLATLPTAVFERLWAIERLCRCSYCTKVYAKWGNCKTTPVYPKGSIRWVQGYFITH